jgi:hypothetical protein
MLADETEFPVILKLNKLPTRIRTTKNPKTKVYSDKKPKEFFIRMIKNAK